MLLTVSPVAGERPTDQYDICLLVLGWTGKSIGVEVCGTGPSLSHWNTGVRATVWQGCPERLRSQCPVNTHTHINTCKLYTMMSTVIMNYSLVNSM